MKERENLHLMSLLKWTTVKIDLLVAKWRAKKKSSVSQKRNHAWKRSIAQNFAEFG